MMMSRFSHLLIAFVLAIVPFFVFIGVTDSLTVNGKIVSDNRFNVGGLHMAIIGLGIVFRILRSAATRDAKSKVVATGVGLLCFVQIANSIGIVRIEPLDWIMPDRHLPELQYSALADNDFIYLTNKTPDGYRRALSRQKGDIVGDARLQKAYAKLCHGGRYRADYARAEQLPRYFDAEELAKIEQRATAMVGSASLECSTAQSNRLMGEKVDQLNRGMDLFDRLEAEYKVLIE